MEINRLKPLIFNLILIKKNNGCCYAQRSPNSESLPGGGGVLLFLDFCTQVCHFGISNPTNRKMDSATHTNPSLGITKYCKLWIISPGAYFQREPFHGGLLRGRPEMSTFSGVKDLQGPKAHMGLFSKGAYFRGGLIIQSLQYSGL